MTSPPEPSPVEGPALDPTAASERIQLIDIVRGIALFGILAANIRGFAGPALAYFEPMLMWPSMPDRIAQAFVDTFIQGKFITIFSFLFGLGFAAQLSRAEERGARFAGTYARRLLILVLIGLLHGLFVWFGDILFAYALVGFLLFFFRRRKDSTIAAWAVALYVVPMILMTLGVMAIELSGKQMPVPDTSPEEIARQVELFSSGTYAEIHVQRGRDVVANNWGYLPVMVFSLLAVFLMGVLGWRYRIFEPRPETVPRYRTVMVAGFGLGIAGNVGATAIRWVLQPPMFPPSPVMLIIQAINTFSIVPLSAAYVCAVVLACQQPVWHRRFGVFAAVGRMALSNYLLQSVLGTLLFYGYGLGLFGRIGPALLVLATLAIFAFQVVASNWWMARFRFGPAEWLWRSLTYARLQPMRRNPA